MNGLAGLAAAHGVATSYTDAAGGHVEVPLDTVRAVLEALGVEPGQPAPDGCRLPATVACFAGEWCDLGLSGRVGPGEVELEDGSRRQVVAGRLPPDLPTGYHRLSVLGAGTAHLVVAPARLPDPRARMWGWMAQLYALRSAGSWGMGDFADLATLARQSGRAGAGLLLVNPLCAAAPAHPLEASPYFPTTRRFRSPLYLRPEQLPEYGRAGADVRGDVDALAAGVRQPGLIDRDRVWAAKLAAFELLVPPDVPPDSAQLEDFARFCALAERHGRDWRRWPALVTPDPRRVALYRWLQQACDDQLAAVQLAASSAGMPVGLVHDLPVGVDPGGADAWALRDVLVGEFTVGAPPDLFNQQGQDWQLPPWDPGRLAASGYQPFREVVAATLRHGGGMRADHILGLFRTWWIPPGADPARGTYVSGDPAALLAVLCLEAHRASALVIGEDLGTVLPAVREALRARGVLGSTVALFATGDPRSWRVAAAASVSTHDLPTAAGWLAGEHVRLRARLGQLGRSEAEEEAAWLASRAVVLGRLEAMGYPAQDAVVGLHALLSASPSEVLLVQPGDAVGDLRQPNLPGTTTEYPNWRLPLAGPDGAERSLEELLADPLGARIVALLGAPPPR